MSPRSNPDMEDTQESPRDGSFVGSTETPNRISRGLLTNVGVEVDPLPGDGPMPSRQHSIENRWSWEIQMRSSL